MPHRKPGVLIGEGFVIEDVFSPFSHGESHSHLKSTVKGQFSYAFRRQK
jgi:hypothetical protein